MTDLTFCYLHMTDHELEVVDTIGSPDYLDFKMNVENVDVPPHMRPPNPEETEVLPSRMHPSYPYGNPFNPKHPANLPRIPYDPASRALFEDMGFGGGGVNGSMRWKELGLDLLLPVDREKEDAEKAAQARKMASGTHHPPPPPPVQEHPQPQVAPDPTDDEEDEDDDSTEDAGSSSREEDE
ncbi:hypothetical protein K474DRAFT_1770524 [Panus rudis PR-1116 ss-1]|nr:hypothetical protein K474DRAFT_1770524 [Panus rudis PR-1116 ss-1]